MLKDYDSNVLPLNYSLQKINFFIFYFKNKLNCFKFYCFYLNYNYFFNNKNKFNFILIIYITINIIIFFEYIKILIKKISLKYKQTF